MIDFDISSHFDKYSGHNFYNQIPYSKLKEDVLKIRDTFFEEQLNIPVALKLQNPYWCFVCILACLASNNKAILLSSIETENSIKLLKEQIFFNQIIEDQNIKNCLNSKKDITNTELIISKDINSPLVFCFTSGSSATPKAVALSFKNFYYSALGFIEFINQKSNEISYLNLPHNHVGGLMVLWRSFLSGGSIVDKFELPLNYISLVPTQLQRMIGNIDELKKLQTIKCILVGGSILPKGLKKTCSEFNLKIFETYGMTETCSLITLNGDTLPYRKINIDSDQSIIVDGEILSTGYYQNNQFIPITPPLKTKDRGEIQSGKFKFIERSDLIFISGGENINPYQVEEVALTFPQIESACCTYIKDEKWGEMNVLLYQTVSDLKINEDELLNYLKLNLHPYHVPKYLFKAIIIEDKQTKINRNKIRELANVLFLKHIFSHEYISSTIQTDKTIIFLHGFTGDKDDFKKIGIPLIDKFNLLFIDLPGHGKTSLKQFNSLIDIFLKLSQFIKIFTDSPILYGYSMGGRIALEIALHYIKPKALILESAGLGLYDKYERSERLKNDQILASKIKSSDTDSFLDSWYKNPIFYHYNKTDTYNDDIRKKLNATTNEWHLAVEVFSPSHFPLLESNLSDLSNSNFPILYLCGEKDEKFLKNAELLKTINIDTFIVRNTGHNPHKTHPSEITQYLSSALKF